MSPMDDLPIKIVLIVAIALIALAILLPGRGARRTALRRLGVLLLVVLAGVAVVFPDLTNTVANFLGVGRGADLLLYGLVVVFIGYVAFDRVHRHRVDVQLTELTRAIAIAAAEKPDARGARDGDGA